MRMPKLGIMTAVLLPPDGILVLLAPGIPDVRQQPAPPGSRRPPHPRHPPQPKALGEGVLTMLRNLNYL